MPPTDAAVARERARAFPLGAAVTVAELERDPHLVLAQLRETEPVAWVPALQAWLVTQRELALAVVRDDATFTVDDPRFSTAQIVGRSMLSVDGVEHARHRGPFARPFRLDAVRERFTLFVTEETTRLLDALEPAGRGELRRGLAGPLSVASMIEALGLLHADTEQVLGWYDAIVTAVTELTAGREPDAAGPAAFADLTHALEPALDRDPESSLVAAAAGEAGGLVPLRSYRTRPCCCSEASRRPRA
jgi:cytochrome P450